MAKNEAKNQAKNLAKPPQFRKGQLIVVCNDGEGAIKEADWIAGLHGYTKKYGWVYRVRGCRYPIAESQIRRIKKKEIRGPN